MSCREKSKSKIPILTSVTHRPLTDEATLRKVLNVDFGLHSIVEMQPLESYDDRNYAVRLESGVRYTLKCHNGVETDNMSVLEAQDAIMHHLDRHGCVCPVPIGSVVFKEFPMTGSPDKRRTFAIRLLSWVDGVPLSSLTPTAALVKSSGEFFAGICKALDTFDHNGAHRFHQWDLSQTDAIQSLISVALPDEHRAELVRGVIQDFERFIKPQLPKFRHGVLQADFNDANIIIEQNRVHGVIDFGDIVYSARVNDVAIATAYAMLSSFGQKDPLGAARLFLQPFCALYPLQEIEIEHLYTLICCRLAISCTLGAYSYQQQPENTYLLLHAQPAWDVLTYLRQADRQELKRQLQSFAS